MAGVLPDATGIHNSHRGEHEAAVLVEDDVISHGRPNDLQADAQRLEGGGVGTVIDALDRRIIHEVHFDEAHAPVVDQGAIGGAQIVLGTGIGGIERIQLFEFTADGADVNRFPGQVVDQPVFVVLI